MKKTFVLAALLSAVSGFAAALAPEIAPEKTWKTDPGVSHHRIEGRDYIRLDIKENESGGRHYAEIPIDLSAHAGKYVTFVIRLRSNGWKQDKKDRSRRGIRFAVSYKHPETGHSVWHHSWDTWDTVDWEKYSGRNENAPREISFFSKLDPGISKAVLLLGTENNFGTAEFDLSSFRVFQPFREDASSHICEYSDRVRNAPVLRGVNSSPNPLTEEDLKTLHEWNANAIRYWISAYPWVFNGKDLNKLRELVAKRLENLDKISPVAQKYGIRLILCYGLPPGGRRGDATLEMQHNPELADFYVETWKRIARHCKGNPAIWAYDLINEPQQTTELAVDYLELQHRAAKAIREVDPDMPVIIEANLLASPEMFRFLEPLKMKDVIYQAHMYVPAEFTHATRGPYPGKFRGELWDKEMLRKTLRPVADFQKRHKARIYVGEFSARSKADGAERYLRDCIELFEEFGWDWTYHSFREAPTWDVEKEWKGNRHVPSPDNPRKRVLLDALKRNK